MSKPWEFFFFFNLSNRYFTTGDQFLCWCLPSLHCADRKSRHTVYSSNVPIRAYQANSLKCWVSCWESHAHVCIHRRCCSGQSSRIFIKNYNFGIAGEFFNETGGSFWQGKALSGNKKYLAGKFCVVTGEFINLQCLKLPLSSPI